MQEIIPAYTVYIYQLINTNTVLPRIESPGFYLILGVKSGDSIRLYSSNKPPGSSKKDPPQISPRGRAQKFNKPPEAYLNVYSIHF